MSIKNKTSTCVYDAFVSIIQSSDRKPTFLQSDKGTEFLNSKFQEYLKSLNVQFYTSENYDIKCALVERFNRTLKNKMWKFFTYTNSMRFIEILPDLVCSYNASFHRSIKTRPILVTVHNEGVIRERLYPKFKTNVKWKFRIADKVRIAESKQIFKKGYLRSWTTEIFKISALLPTSPRTYRITDYDGEPITGTFYEQELQKLLKKTKYL